MIGNRKALPRCQFGTTNGYIESVCEEPAVALWHWPGDSMYVCERHDLIIQETEDE